MGDCVNRRFAAFGGGQTGSTRLHQPRSLKLTAQVAHRAFERRVINRGEREERLHRADGGIDLPAGIVGEIRRRADELIRRIDQIARVAHDVLKIGGLLRGGVGVVNLADMVGDVVCTLERGELAQILADGVAVSVDIVIERISAL